MNKFYKWFRGAIMNSYKGLMKFIVVLFVSFMSITPSVRAEDNSNVVYEGAHNFSECLERLGCYDISNWGPCGAHSWPFSEQAAYEKAMDHIEFTLLKKANVAAEVKNIKTCHHGCGFSFDQNVSGKWKRVGDSLSLWNAEPGNYRLNILSDGYLGCGAPYKQISFCPSSCTVKLNIYPVDPLIDPKDAVAIDNSPKTEPKLSFEWSVRGNVKVDGKYPTSNKVPLSKGMTFTFQDPGGSISNGMTLAVGEGGAKIMIIDIESGLEPDGTSQNNILYEKITFIPKAFGKGLYVAALTAKGLWSTLWSPNPSVRLYQKQQWNNFKTYSWNNTKIVLTNYWNSGIDIGIPDYVPCFGGRISISSISKDFLLNYGVSKVLGKLAVSHKGFGNILNKISSKTIFGKSVFGKENDKIFNSIVPLITDWKRYFPSLKPHKTEKAPLELTIFNKMHDAGSIISPQSSGVLNYMNDGSVKLTVDEGHFKVENLTSLEKNNITTGHSIWIIPPPNDEPVITGVFSSYLGCYIDKPDRDIKGYHFNHGQMTNKICINTCREKGFGVAATQFSTHCFCGNSFGDYGKAPKQAECSYKCKGNEKTNCGGYWRNSVYQIEEGGFPGVKVPPPSQPSGNSTTTGNTHSKPGVSSFKTQYGEINPNGEITITTFHTSPKGVNNIAYTSIVVKDENSKVYIQDPYKTNNNPASKRKKPIPSNHFGVYPTEKTGYTVRDLIDAGMNGTVKSVSTRYSKILSGSNAKVIGDKLKVILHLKLNNLPAGKKYIYARTVDLQSVDSGWKKVGEFTVIENTASPMANSDTQSNKPVSITQTLRCPSSQQQTYRLYTNNYNELQKLMLQGHGGIPEAQVFYKKYKFYKDCYELSATQLDHESDDTVSAAVSDLTATTPILSQTVYASADAYVYAYNYRNWNRSNRGRYDQLVAGWHPTGGESRAYINFDLSGIGKSKISKAILKLYHFQTSGNNGVELGIYRVTSPWNEGSNTYHSGRKEKTTPPGDISWVQQPKIDAAPITTFNPGTGMRDWTKINITSLVKQWLSDTPNYGIVIKPIGHLGRNISVSTYHFASRERDQNLDKPKGENKSPVLILSRERKADSAIRGNGKSKQKQLYQEYIKAYNELHTTMQEGRGDISQAQKIYKNAKDRYNSFLERRRRQ